MPAALKGSAWLVNFDFLKETFGPTALEKVLGAMDPADRDLLSKPMVAASWGPDFNVYMRFILTADKILGKGNMALLPQACTYHFTRDTKLYALFFKVLNTETIFQSVSVLWKTYFNPCGQFKVVNVGKKHIQIHLTEFPDMPINHEVYHSQYMVKVLEVTGAKNFKVAHPECTARGDKQCLWDMTWE